MFKKARLTVKIMKRISALLTLYSKEETERILQEATQNLNANYSKIKMKDVDRILDEEFKKVLDK